MGLSLMYGSGVFLYYNNAFATWSESIPPWCDTSLIILLTVFTPKSALFFDCGYSADDSVCVTPHFVRKFWNAVDINCGPPSELSSSGILELINIAQYVLIRVSAMVL